MYIIDVKNSDGTVTKSREVESLFECFAYFISMAEQLSMAGWKLELPTKEVVMMGTDPNGVVASITLWSDD